MKRFFKIFYVIILTAFSLLLLSSCSKDEDSIKPISDTYIDLGEVSYVGNNGYFEILRDDNVTLEVIEYNGSRKIELGERVFFTYKVFLSEGMDVGSKERFDVAASGSTLKVKVLLFNNVHSVPIISESFIEKSEAHRNDSIGRDLIRVYDAEFKGNYLNVKVEYLYYDPNTQHRINLVWDDTRTDTDSVFLTLRHNAMGDKGSGQNPRSQTGLCSFKLSGLIPEGEESIDVKLLWNMTRKGSVGEYVEEEDSYRGTFAPFAGNDPANPKMGGQNFITPPANDNTTFVK